MRELKYRVAHALVFGLPVIGLQHFGPRLGGDEAGVWVGLMQMILAGWVVYVSATGMVVDGLLRRRITSDLAVALLSLAVYFFSVVGWMRLLLQHSHQRRIFWFDIAVIVLIIWCGVRWWSLARRART